MILRACGALAVCLLLSGCTPSLEEACEHYGVAHTNEGDVRGITTERARAECLERLGPMQTSNPKRFRCEARCMMESSHAVSNAPEIDDCPKKCAP